MAIAAGKLNKRVSLQTASLAADSYGAASTETWATTATLWANVEELTGSEGYEAQQTASSLSHRVTIRYRTVTPQQRLLYGSRALRINAVLNPGQRNEMVELLCTEEDI